MTRGRRPAPYPEEFRQLVLNRRQFLGISLAAIAKRYDVNRGTLSAFFNGERRSLGEEDREKLFAWLGLSEEEANHFRATPGSRKSEPLILLDPPTSPHPPLDRGQRFLICADYPEAIQEFEAVYDAADEEHQHMLQADAAARLAWVYFEKGEYRKSKERVIDGISLVATHVGANFAQIMDSIKPGSHSALCPLNDEASHVLSRLLQIRYKLYIESVIYCAQEVLRRKADEAIAQSVALDRHLDLHAALGHDLRWQAVLASSELDEQQKKNAARLLSASHEQFVRGSLGDAYLHRDNGIVAWQTGRYISARRHLMKAVDALSLFADSRALGPTFRVLANVAHDCGADEGVARRYALAGAALHPYGFVAENAEVRLRVASETGLRRDIDDVRSGAKPFDMLKPILSRLTEGSSTSAEEKLEQHLSLVMRHVPGAKRALVRNLQTI